MIKSTVYTSMRDTDNNIDCSFAVIVKEVMGEQKGVLIVWKDLEVAAFNYFDIINNYDSDYLLLKHYNELEYAKKDFYKLIGKMCKKHINGPEKYFVSNKKEDNRMLFFDFLNEIDFENFGGDRVSFDKRKAEFLNFVKNNIKDMKIKHY